MHDNSFRMKQIIGKSFFAKMQQTKPEKRKQIKHLDDNIFMHFSLQNQHVT